MAANLVHDKFWVDKALYHDAEKKFYESLAKLHKNGQKSEEVGKTVQETNTKKKNSKSKNNNHKNTEPKVSETKNLKNNAFSSGDGNVDKRGGYEVIENKEDEPISEKDESVSEKKLKKDSKDKKKDKKSKKKDRDENKGGGVGLANVSQESFPKTSLAGEIAKARQHIKSSLESVPMDGSGLSSSDTAKLTGVIERLENLLKNLEKRVEVLEKKCSTCPPANTSVGQCQTAATKTSVGQVQTVAAKLAVGQSQTKKGGDDDDDVDLFGSESEEEDEEAKKIKEQRLAEYAAKKSKKPVLIAKSNIILDVKPWDDETDMKQMEKEVRKIEMDGLLWGASKLVPLAYGIHKLQISCVVEDDKVSVDQLIETLEQIEEYVQSVDIAAFNKI